MAQPSESLREILNGPQSARNLIPVHLIVAVAGQHFTTWPMVLI
jgi:hypothetical protein